MGKGKNGGHRGRHQSSCKDGHKTIRWIEGLEEVTGVTIGRTTGRASVGRGKPVGYVKLQRHTEAGIKALLQCSYGAQEIFIIVDSSRVEAVRSKIERKYPR